MAAAAATAVIAPLALLSAPAAFAEQSEQPPSGTPSDASSQSASSSPSAPESVPASESASTTPPAPSDGTGVPGGAPSGSTTPSGSATPSDSAEPSESADPADPEDPIDPAVPYCEEIDGDYTDAKVSADIKGLPGKIVAGDGFHAFQLVVTNKSDLDLRNVAFYAEVENFEIDEAKYLSSHVDLQFKNPESGAWERIGSDEWAGDYFFFTETLRAKASQKVDLRVGVDAGAPAGDAYTFASGAYLDNVEGQECVAEGWALYDFTVLRPGSPNPSPGTAKPGTTKPGDGVKGPVKKPQGDVSALPTGSLAETGSDPVLPVVGLVGGVAVVAGAGAVFAARRRRAGADA
ncbi:hypothetical protein GCM10010358_22990 [Streptomyces minutiscleroticus]|uniref:LPXTG cell wall anchor domain-containing protein n=2 Tax=Streptomyces minutiscleroticus TaxID=68238 RepID=A0A918KLI5_9ACTN|nr:hypothetical protein GCM10010358_22990 [Streptomyces minutiscleroticus]